MSALVIDERDRRAHLLASLEWGTNPLLGRDMYAQDETEEEL